MMIWNKKETAYLIKCCQKLMTIPMIVKELNRKFYKGEPVRTWNSVRRKRENLRYSGVEDIPLTPVDADHRSKSNPHCWSTKLTNILIEMAMRSESNQAIAKATGRTVSSVKRKKQRIKNHGVIHIPNLPSGGKNQFKTKAEKAKILIFDLETSPMRGLFWSLWKQNINMAGIDKHSSLISWSAKWLCDDKIMSMRVTGKEAVARKDKRILKPLWKLIDEADIVIGHNVKGYDMKYFNTRCLLNGLHAPSQVDAIDTLLLSRQKFRLPSNALKFWLEIIGEKEKMATNFQLWVDCCEKGNERKLDYMMKYNEVDVIGTEDVYMHMRNNGWIHNHPNLGLYFEGDLDNFCPTCQEYTMTTRKGKFYYTPSGRYQAYVCKTCHSYKRARKSDITKAERKSLLVNVGR